MRRLMSVIVMVVVFISVVIPNDCFVDHASVAT